MLRLLDLIHILFYIVQAVVLLRDLGASGMSLGLLGVVLGCLGCLLGASWAPLGAFWEGPEGLLGRSSGLLEQSWGLLGSSCELCCNKVIFNKNRGRFWANFDSQMGPPKEPKWSQTWIKIRTKIEDEKRTSSGPSLGGFWTILVAILGFKIMKIHWFF